MRYGIKIEKCSLSAVPMLPTAWLAAAVLPPRTSLGVELEAVQVRLLDLARALEVVEVAALAVQDRGPLARVGRLRRMPDLRKEIRDADSDSASPASVASM